MSGLRLFFVGLLSLFFCLTADAGETFGHDGGRRDEPSASVGVPVREQGLISDARQLYRVCGQRPQRLPASGGGQKPHSSVVHRSIVKPFLLIVSDHRCRLETAPFASAAASDYYVYALRRLRC